MPYEIKLLDNLQMLPLKRFIKKSDQPSGRYPMLLPSPSATLKQMHESVVLLCSAMGPISDANLLDIYRQDKIRIFNQTVDKRKFDSTPKLIEHIRTILERNSSGIAQIIKQFTLQDLLSQATFLFAAKETLCERANLKRLDWIPSGTEGVESQLEISREDSNNFSISFSNGLSMLDSRTLQAQLAGEFELKLMFKVVTGKNHNSSHYFNFTTHRPTEMLQVSVVKARYVFNDPRMMGAAMQLGYTTSPINQTKQARKPARHNPSSAQSCKPLH